ncbi:MAG TPA: DUF1501 domain-containing protein [Xanthomonadaceae bacterium]|nr:DUF1501 domain-containing protein [Xanthomonadaceae bacterium]
MTTRRNLLKAIGVGAVSLTLWPRLAWSSAGASSSAQPLLLVVMLRGGLDGLHALPPVGDNAWGALRGSLPFAPGDNSLKPLPLDRNFALHPALPFAAQLFQQRAFLPVVAIAPPYQGRSHFEAQDCVENGSSGPSGAQDGWMNRCVSNMRGEEGLAIANAMPLIMRGSAKVSTWSPPLPTSIDPNLLQRLDTLYAEDSLLAEAYSRAIAESHDEAVIDADAPTMAAAAPSNAAGKGAKPAPANANGNGALPNLMGAAGKFMGRSDGPQIAFVEDTGWDTHAAEVATLQRKLGQLDAGLKNYHEAMGSAWDRTVVMVVTEFGRTAQVNGTGGTDHGTGGVAFLAGGAVAGGRVAGQWPGIAHQDLNEGRDVHATTDMRALFKGVLAGHLLVPASVLDTKVFPGSSGIRPMDGLLRSARVGAAA